MRRWGSVVLVLALLASCAGISGPGPDETWLTVRVIDEQGEPVQGVAVTYWVGGVEKPSSTTDVNGERTWSIRRSQSATRIDVDAWVVSVTTSSGSSWIDGDGIAEVSWADSPAKLVVTLVVDPGFGPTMPTATKTARPSAGTATKPATPGPSTTPLPTPTMHPDPYGRSAIIEIGSPDHLGRYQFRVIEQGGLDVYMQTYDGDDYPIGCGPDCESAYGWVRAFIRCDEDYQCPPSIIVCTPGAPPVTETQTAEATIAPTQTPYPTLTPWPTYTPYPTYTWADYYALAVIEGGKLGYEFDDPRLAEWQRYTEILGR